MNPGLRTIVDVAFAVLECPRLRRPSRPEPALLHEYPLRVGRRGPHFSGPSAGATLRG